LCPEAKETVKVKKILIYSDRGAGPFSIKCLQSELERESVNTFYSIELVDKEVLKSSKWHKDCAVLIFPGGRDIPYHSALKGSGNDSIIDYVWQGGKFWGICAGAYYGSSKIEFEKGGDLEVIATRDLKFFPGVASGPAYGPGQFCYRTQRGALIAKLQFRTSICAAYYNGGCCFVDATQHTNVTILGNYEEVLDKPAAIIDCAVGDGTALLCGVHPEYSGYFSHILDFCPPDLLQTLQNIENQRRELFVSLLNHLHLDNFAIDTT
jgi:biotin--protein ligase